MTPPKPLKTIGITMVSGRGRGKTQLSTKKVTFGAPGGIFGDFHEKTMISQLFPPFGEKGTFPPPPTQNLAMVMLFQWFWGVQFHPNREIMLFPVIYHHFHYFPYFS